MRRNLSRLLLGIGLVLAAIPVRAQSPAALADAQKAVMKVDDEFRLAKLHDDTATLQRILASGFRETNQNGNSRDKPEMIELFRTFPIERLTTDEHQVRIVDNAAFVTGSQTEDGDRMLFMRSYIRNGDAWQLLSSMQFHPPEPAAAGNAGGAGDDVMKVDEAYRLAKLNRDLGALDRVLADGFNETNQNGNSRNKALTLELWKDFMIGSLTTDSHQVRVAGDTAMVTGTQTENGTERMLFSRVYVKGPAGWQLLSSMQFRDPAAAGNSDVPVR